MAECGDRDAVGYLREIWAGHRDEDLMLSVRRSLRCFGEETFIPFIEEIYQNERSVEIRCKIIGKSSVVFVRHEAAQEMRVGPSESVYRSWLQTASSCMGQEPLW